MTTNILDLNNDQIINLILKHGYLGYGILTALIQLQKQADNHMIKNDINYLAYQLHIDPHTNKQTFKILKILIASEFFTKSNDEKFIFNHEVLKSLEKQEKILLKKAQGGKHSKPKTHHNAVSKQNNVANATSILKDSSKDSSKSLMANATESNSKCLANANNNYGKCLANATESNGKCYKTLLAKSSKVNKTKLNKNKLNSENNIYSRVDKNDHAKNSIDDDLEINSTNYDHLQHDLEDIDLTNKNAINKIYVALLNNYPQSILETTTNDFEDLENHYKQLNVIDEQEKPQALLIYLDLTLNVGITKEMLLSELENYQKKNKDYTSFLNWLKQVEATC